MENVYAGICTLKRVCAAVLGVVIVLSLAAVSLHAQQGAGTVLGVVTDPTGAVVEGATITITDEATGVARTVRSGAQGLYEAPQLAAGTYTIEASAPGFSQTKVTGVVVIVATQTRTDLTLHTGQVTQSVQVTAAAPTVETTSSSLGTVVNEQRVADLPLNGRNWTDLTLMQPGISQVEIPALTGNAVLAGYNGTIFISNGATDRSNNYLLDGAIMENFAGLNNSSINNTSLGVDGIDQYKVVTNTPSAEYGMRMGSQTVLVSKGGTNQFHGDAYDYLRNSALDARNYFDALDTTNSNGFGTDKSLPYPGERIPPFRRNDFGGSFGGPIKKDKTFFYTAYEEIQQQQAGNAGLPISLTTLPKACFVDQTGTLQSRVPATIKNVNAYGTCVSGTVNGGAVPATFTVNPVTLPFADLYPQPNVTGYTFNYTYPYVQPTTERYGQGRLDQTFSASDSAFGRYTQDDSTSLTSASFPGFVTDRYSGSQFITASELHIFSPSLLNTAQFSVSRTYVSTAPTDVAPITVTPNLQLVVNDSTIGNVVGGITPQTGISASGTGQTFSGAAQYIYSSSDDLFRTKGKHGLKFGFRWDNYHYNVVLIQGGPGTVSFGSLGEFFGINEGTSLDYSSFSSELPGAAKDGFDYINNAFGAYAQDDYQIKPKLTLNLGLRYDIATPPHNTVAANACSYRTAQDPTCVPGNMFRNRTWLNFSPRLGFAWDVTGKQTTAVRGGAGVLYDVGSYGFLMYTNVQQTPPLVTYISVANNSINPSTPLTVPLPTTGVSQTPRIVDYNLNQPLLYEYNLEIQQRLPGNWAITVAYVGSQGRHLYQLREGNPVTPAGLTSAGLPIYGCWNPSLTSTAALTSSGACPSGFTTVGPRVNSSVTSFGQETLFETFGSSWYNAGQLQAVKQISHGLQMEIFYTFSRMLDDGQGLSANEANAFQYQLPIGYNEYTDGDVGPSAFDIKHNFRANFIYHLPSFSSHANGISEKVLNGWWVSSIASANTGVPLTPILGSDRELVGNSAVYERPNLDPSFNAKKAVTGNINGWINNSMFDLQPAGELGSSGRGNLRAPGQVSWDFSAVKDTKVGLLGEAGSVEFRAEFFNILNHPNWGFPANADVWSSGTPSTVAAGQIGSASTPVGISNPSVITTTLNDSRQIQFALKLLF